MAAPPHPSLSGERSRSSRPARPHISRTQLSAERSAQGQRAVPPPLAMCVVRDQPDATYTCLACRVLGTPIRECAHRKSLGMCRNRANHRSDVVYFRHTGVPTINGCGYCKWAKEYPPPPGTTLPNNPGWPGCCRPPRPEDAPLIDKDHYSAIVAAWDQRTLAGSTIRTQSSTQKRAPIPQFSEKSEPEPPRTPPLSAASPRRDTLRGRDESPRYSSRRQGSYDNTPPAAPIRQGSYDSQPQRHGTVRAPALPSARGGVQPPPPAPADQLSLSALSNSLSTLRVSNTAMSDSGSESSNTTVGTDSTDYLSDESEEELNRLAIARAIAIERQRVEEAEYESARRGLRDIDLTTPIQWGMNGGNNTSGAGATNSVRSMQYLSFGEAYGRRQR